MEYQEAQALLQNAIFNCIPLRDVINICASVLSTPLRFTFYGQINDVLYSNDYPYDDFLEWKNRVTPEGEEAQLYMKFLSVEYTFQQGSTPYIFPIAKHLSRRRYLCMSMMGNQRAGHITIPEVHVPLEDLSPELISLCSRFIALSCFQNKSINKTSGDQEAMNLLMLGSKTTYRQVINLATDTTFPEYGEYRLIVFHLKNTDNRSNTAELATHASFLLQSNWLQQTTDCVAVLAENRTLSKSTLSYLRALPSRYNCTCCISPMYTNIMESFIWSKRIFSLPVFISASAGETIRYEDWGDLGLYQESGLNSHQLLSFVYPPILQIFNYDQKNKTEYLNTLAAFIENGSNQKQTAKALFLHINTVAYRIQRISELFDIRFSHSNEIYMIAHSIRLLRYIHLVG